MAFGNKNYVLPSSQKTKFYTLTVKHGAAIAFVYFNNVNYMLFSIHWIIW